MTLPNADTVLLPNGCSRARAIQVLAEYDIRRTHGYKNQRIAARNMVKMRTGMNVRDLRRWLKENAMTDTSRIHKAEPRSNEDLHCVVCGQWVKRVPGGQGPTWVHADSGAVAAPTA